MLAPGLSVYIDDGFTRRMVTRYCTSLRFTKAAPGGHQTLQVQMTLPHDTFPHLGPNDLIVVTDQTTARTLFEGYLKNPTPVDGPLGQFFNLTALGGMWRASDETRPLVYLQRGVGDFVKSAASADSATIDQGPAASAPAFQRLRVQFNRGQLVATAANISGDNGILQRAGMSLGAIRVLTVSGKTDGGYRTTLYYNAGSIDIANGTAMQTGAVDNTYWAATDFPSGTTDTVALALRRTGSATNIADDETWSDFIDVLILGQRMDRYGTLLTGSAGLVSPAEVLASDVVEDLLGRLLTMCDPTTAVVDDTEFGIDQLAYPDGARAGDVLTHLMAWETDYLWEILERLPNGLHRFGWRAWPTAPRYVVSTADGWVQSGSDQNVCNRVLVTWTDAAGNSQSLTVTAQDLVDDGLATAADLDGVGDGLTPGQIRDADQFNISDGKGSAVNAARIGRGVLLDTIKPPTAGKVTIRRKVIDLLTGNEVWPWELEPGYVCRIREKGLDLRTTEADYDHGEQAMELTLGTPVLTDQQRLARLDVA